MVLIWSGSKYWYSRVIQSYSHSYSCLHLYVQNKLLTELVSMDNYSTTKNKQKTISWQTWQCNFMTKNNLNTTSLSVTFHCNLRRNQQHEWFWRNFLKILLFLELSLVSQYMIEPFNQYLISGDHFTFFLEYELCSLLRTRMWLWNVEQQ